MESGENSHDTENRKKSEVASYRPISLLPILSKVLEKYCLND
jgi:hypothetical protein